MHCRNFHHDPDYDFCFQKYLSYYRSFSWCFICLDSRITIDDDDSNYNVFVVCDAVLVLFVPVWTTCTGTPVQTNDEKITRIYRLFNNVHAAVPKRLRGPPIAHVSGDFLVHRSLYGGLYNTPYKIYIQNISWREKYISTCTSTCTRDVVK